MDNKFVAFFKEITSMKEKMKKALSNAGIILGISALLFSTVCGIISIYNYTKSTKYMVYEEMTRLQYEATKFELTNAVNDYIISMAPSSCLNGIVVVNKCVEYDIDICFVLAQGLQESHFGTTGLARKTNSVWNVLAFDGFSYEAISSEGKYKSPDDSVEPYLQLLHKRYLVKGKTEYDMLNEFVDKSGNRYASSTTYESSLVSKFNSIKSTTPIDSLSLELKKYAMILGY